MTEANEPAMPAISTEIIDFGYKTTTGEKHTPGESKREKWSAQIMAALNMNNYKNWSQERLAEIAVNGADALINELNKNEKV